MIFENPITDRVKGKFIIHFDTGETWPAHIINYMISGGGDMLILFAADGSIYNFRNITHMQRLEDS